MVSVDDKVVKETLSVPAAIFVVVGVVILAGAPTVTGADGVDAAPVPALFVARTVQV